MIGAELERCLPWLAAAVRKSPGESLQRAIDEILANRATLWAGDRYCMVTQLVATAEERKMHVWLSAGNLDEVLAVRATIEGWARQQGASAVTLNGRSGWKRLLRPYGYTMTNGELRKVL